LADHIKVCPKHPMRDAEAALATAEAQNARNLGLLEVIERQGVELERAKEEIARLEGEHTIDVGIMQNYQADPIAIRVAVTDPDEPVGAEETLADVAEGWKVAAIDAQRELKALRQQQDARDLDLFRFACIEADHAYLINSNVRGRLSPEAMLARWRESRRPSDTHQADVP
jgi:hypothetical protein